MTTYDDRVLAEKWLHQRVFIRKGRYVGHRGEVVGFINGRIRVQIGDDIVNKQESQLELYDPCLHSAISDIIPGISKSQRPANRSAPSLIGSRVRILNGKFGGYCGLVSKGGNGYFAVQIDTGVSNTIPSSIVMKRSSELVILSNAGSTCKEQGETITMTSSNGEDVHKAAIILLDLMQSEIGSRKRGRSPERFETIEGY